jgi:biofilm protein TabA
MIADVLKNYKIYLGMHDNLEEGFKALEKCLKKPLPAENCRMEVDGLQVVVQYYKTKDFSEKKFEGHRKCIDIQYIVDGRETIYWANTTGLVPCTEYSEERDHLSYADGDSSSPIRLKNGLFAIFLPDDAHKTGCLWDASSDVVKLIVKVKL